MAKEAEIAKARKDRQSKQNKYYDTSSKRNESWDKLAQERTKTEQLNRQKELQSSKAMVMSKMRSVWTSDEKVEDMTCVQFIVMISKIDSMDHKLFEDLLLLGSSLNSNMQWDIFKLLVKEAVIKNSSA